MGSHERVAEGIAGCDLFVPVRRESPTAATRFTPPFTPLGLEMKTG
jgi:hypothetical protein